MLVLRLELGKLNKVYLERSLWHLILSLEPLDILLMSAEQLVDSHSSDLQAESELLAEQLPHCNRSTSTRHTEDLHRENRDLSRHIRSSPSNLGHRLLQARA